MLFLDENIFYGYSLEAPHWGTSNEYPQLMFSSRNKKDISIFWVKKAPYLLLWKGVKKKKKKRKIVWHHLWIYCMIHTCHKLWTKICEIRQNFKGDLTKFCEIFLNHNSVLCLFLHKICGLMVRKFCKIWNFYGNCLPDGPNFVRFYLQCEIWHHQALHCMCISLNNLAKMILAWVIHVLCQVHDFQAHSQFLLHLL